MAIITKNSNTGGAIPTAGQLQVGELAVNTADGLIYTKHTDNVVKRLSANPPSSANLTGVPTASTAAVGTNTTQLATTAFVLANVTDSLTSTSTTLALSAARGKSLYDTKAPNASPALTGTPTAPTAAVGTNTEQIATTAFVLANTNNNLTSTSTTLALSAAQGKVLQDGKAASTTIGSMRGQTTVSADTTLSQATHGGTSIVNVTAGISIAMPAPNTVTAGTVFEIHGQSYTLNMNGNSTDFGSSFSVAASEVFRLISDGGSFYRIVRTNARSGVAPNKAAGTSHSVAVIYQAATNLYLQIWLQGTYMNSLRLNSGTTTSLGDIIAKAGNDLNNYTWAQTITAIIPQGYYFRLENDPDIASGHVWESVSMRSYPLV